MLSNHFQPLVAELLRSFNEILLYFFMISTMWLVGFQMVLLFIWTWVLSICLFVSLRIQSECKKIRTRVTPNTDTFYEVWLFIKKKGTKIITDFYPSHYVDLNNTNAKSGMFWATKRMFGTIMLLYYAWNTAVLSKVKAKR